MANALAAEDSFDGGTGLRDRCEFEPHLKSVFSNPFTSSIVSLVEMKHKSPVSPRDFHEIHDSITITGLACLRF